MTDADLPLEHVHVEPAEPSDGPAPAVFVLHGRGADEEDLLPVARELPDALHVVSLRAPDRQGPGYSWYTILTPEGNLHSSQPDAEEFRRSLDRVGESVEAATDAYGIDPDRRGLFGFSQGGIASLALTLESPADFAWTVGLHCYLPESHADRAPDGVAGYPVFLGAGTADRIIPADRAERAAERFRELGADVTFRSYDAGHGIGPAELDDVTGWVADRV